MDEEQAHDKEDDDSKEETKKEKTADERCRESFREWERIDPRLRQKLR